MKRGKNFKLTNKLFYIFAAILILAAVGISIYAQTIITIQNPSHTSDQIYLQYNSTCFFTLTNAIANGLLEVTPTTLPPCDAPPFPKTSPYHLASQILINVGPYTMTLQEAYNHLVFAGGSAPNYNATQSYTTTLPAGGQLGSQIYTNITNGIVLQNAITNGSTSSISSQPIGTSCFPQGISTTCLNPGTWNGTACTGYYPKLYYC